MKAYIYTIRSHQTELFYIGSTFQHPSMRMCGHRKNYKLWLNKKGNYVSSFEILKFSDNYIEILLEVEVQSKLELRRLEGENIRKHNCVNKVIAGRTQQEWCQENKVNIAEYNVKYYQDNAVKIAEYQSEKITCECGCIITTGCKARHYKTQKHLTLMRTLTLLPVVSSEVLEPIVEVVVLPAD